MKRFILLFLFLVLNHTVSVLAEPPAVSAPAGVVDAGNAICPVSGQEANPEITLVHGGKRYSFCCKNCAAKFKKDPEKYLAK